MINKSLGITLTIQLYMVWYVCEFSTQMHWIWIRINEINNNIAYIRKSTPVKQYLYYTYVCKVEYNSYRGAFVLPFISQVFSIYFPGCRLRLGTKCHSDHRWCQQAKAAFVVAVNATHPDAPERPKVVQAETLPCYAVSYNQTIKICFHYCCT